MVSQGIYVNQSEKGTVLCQLQAHASASLVKFHTNGVVGSPKVKVMEKPHVGAGPVVPSIVNQVTTEVHLTAIIMNTVKVIIARRCHRHETFVH